MSRCVVILGMHRSGTSCVTRILNRAGLDLGENLLKAPVPDNLLGHWENISAIKINDRILAASGGSWDQVPGKLVVDEAASNEIAHFVDQFRSIPAWGWKDPRTTVTYPAWRPHLPEHMIAACIRHPYAVAQSLNVREGWPRERGLQLWIEYNRQLLEIVEAQPGVCWYHHGVAPADSARQIKNICDAAGLSYSGELLALINTHLDHHGTQIEIDEPEVRDLYNRLTELANSQLMVRCVDSHAEETWNGIPAAKSPEPAMVSQLEQLAGELRTLSEVVKASDAVTQQAMWMTRQLENACIGLKTESAICDKVHGEQAALAQLQIAELRARVEQIQPSLDTLRNLITVVQSQQRQFGQSIADCQAALTFLREILPLRIYRALAKPIKFLWNSIRPGRAGEGRSMFRKAPPENGGQSTLPKQDQRAA